MTIFYIKHKTQQIKHMKLHFEKFLCALVFLIANLSHAQMVTNTLMFYAVSEQEIPNGQSVYLSSTSKSVYISKIPDLIVTNIQAVFPNTNVVVIGDKVSPEDMPQFLAVKLLPSDSKSFLSLVRASKGKSMLLKVGETNLGVWKVGDMPEARFELTFQNQNELHRAENSLRALLK